MTWLRTDDRYYRHPKVRELLRHPKGSDALTLNEMARCFCADQLTDGVVEKHDLREMVPWHNSRLKSALQSLVKVGLWDEVDPGVKWRVHDFLEYNFSKEEVLAQREKAKWRKRKQRNTSRRDNVRDISARHGVSHTTPVPVSDL